MRYWLFMNNILKKQRFGDKTQIFYKMFNFFELYLLLFSVPMFLAGGDGVPYSFFLIGVSLLLFLVNKLFMKFEEMIKEIVVSENSISIKYVEKNKTKTMFFSMKDLNIKLNVSSMISDGEQTLFIPFFITTEDGTTFIIKDHCNDIDHSLQLLKFMKQLNCCAINIEADLLESPTMSIKLRDAVLNYIQTGIYDKKAFHYYPRMIKLVIAFISLSVLFLIWIIIITVMGFDIVHWA